MYIIDIQKEVFWSTKIMKCGFYYQVISRLCYNFAYQDEEMLLDLCKALLETLGYHILVTHAGREGVRAVDTLRGAIDLALIDLVLSDMEEKPLYLHRQLRP